MLQHGWKSSSIIPVFLLFVHHGRKITPVLYIYPSTGTENYTEPFNLSLSVTDIAVKLRMVNYSFNGSHCPPMMLLTIAKGSRS